MKDWTLEVQFKNLPKVELPFESLSYTVRASKAGSFTAVVPLGTESIDVLRGSEVVYKFKGEPRFRGKITNKKPLFGSGIIEFQGTDWNGILFDRQIAFQSFDNTLYNYDKEDYWGWNKVTEPPGNLIVMEGKELILLMLRHFCGYGVNDTVCSTNELLYGFNIDNMETGYTNKTWRFEGETLGNAFSKISEVMQASTMRFGYNWWVDEYKRFWLRRYGDSIYGKPLHATWSPPEEDSSSVVNRIHLIGGIATPFPSDREGLTNISGFTTPITATNTTGQYHAPPTADSKGWGCYIKADAYPTNGDTLQLQCDIDYGSVSGDLGSSIMATLSKSGPTSMSMSFGFYYQINNDNSEFRDALWPDGELRNWSNREQLTSRKGHSIRTVTFYYRQTDFSSDAMTNFCGAKLKIYTNSAPPAMDGGGGTDIPKGQGTFHETEAGVYDLNLNGVFNAYAEKYKGKPDEEIDFMRVSIVFDKGVNQEEWDDIKMKTCAAGGGSGGDINFKIVSMQVAGSGYEIAAFWDEASDKTAPDPADIWGIGFEFNAGLDTGNSVEIAIDHLFVGFGEIEVERRDDLSVAILDREVDRWILDRHCHSWARAEHLADVLLENLKYTMKSRTATLSYFNPELRLNQIIPVAEYGVEWQYVINQIQVSVGGTGTKQLVNLGTPRPDPDAMFEFYQVEIENMQTGGAGRTVHDWVANTPCWSTCERFCEFACLSDYSDVWRRGGQVCQTSRELTCASCESIGELNPCITTCLKYSEIARIVQRPPMERSNVETTLLTAGTTKAVTIPAKPVSIEPDIRALGRCPAIELTRCVGRVKETYGMI